MDILLLWSGLKLVTFEPSHIPGVECMIIVLRIDHNHGIAGAIFSVPDEHSCSPPFGVFGWMLTATLECAGNAECLCKLKPFWTLSVRCSHRIADFPLMSITLHPRVSQAKLTANGNTFCLSLSGIFADRKSVV